jgi:protein-tyrosine phosphatase
MRELVPGILWLGNSADARDLQRVLDVGILTLIDLAAEEPLPALPRSIVYCRFPIVDGQQPSKQVLRVAIETVASLLKKGIPTLVFCGAGMSRSPAVVAAALSIVYSGTPDERLSQVVAGHPHDVSGQLWADMRELCLAIAVSSPPPITHHPPPPG